MCESGSSCWVGCDLLIYPFSLASPGVLLFSLKNVKLNWSLSFFAAADAAPLASCERWSVATMADWFRICSFLLRKRNSVPGDETPLLCRLCEVFKMLACLLKKALPWSITFWTILGRARRFSTRNDEELLELF